MLLVISGMIASGKSSVAKRMVDKGFTLVPSLTTCSNDPIARVDMMHQSQALYLQRQPSIIIRDLGGVTRSVPLSDEYHNALIGEIDAVLVVDHRDVADLQKAIVSQGYERKNVSFALLQCEFMVSVRRATHRAGGFKALDKYAQEALLLSRNYADSIHTSFSWDIIKSNSVNDYCALDRIAKDLYRDCSTQKAKEALWRTG